MHVGVIYKYDEIVNGVCPLKSKNRRRPVDVILKAMMLHVAAVFIAAP